MSFKQYYKTWIDFNFLILIEILINFNSKEIKIIKLLS